VLAFWWCSRCAYVGSPNPKSSSTDRERALSSFRKV
jgi:hypothetical protein